MSSSRILSVSVVALLIATVFQEVTPQRFLPVLAQPPLQGNVLVEPPKPYSFGFESDDGLGTKQHRQEAADGVGAVKGSYGYVDPIGVYREVEYVADVNGYRANIRSNEPGVAAKDTAHASYLVKVPPPAAVAQGLAYQTINGLRI